MKKQPKKETHYDEEVWVNPTTESLRKTECLCLHCGRLKMHPGQENNCRIAQAFYEICLEENIALIITRCPAWADKQESLHEELPKKKIIRSELTHKQDVALVHPGPSKELLERIDKNFEKLQRQQQEDGK